MKTDPYFNYEPNVCSSTDLREARKSSRALLKRIKDKQKPEVFKSHFDFGNAFELYLHDKIHGTSYFMDQVYILKKPVPDKTYNYAANKEAKQKAIDSGLYVIDDDSPSENMEVMRSMVEAVRRNKFAWQLIEVAEYQRTLRWTDPATGINLKTRPDYDIEELAIVLDVKTTASCEPSDIQRKCANLDYPIQAVMQMDGLTANGWRGVDTYYWLFVEKSLQGEAVLVEFAPDDWAACFDRYRYALEHKVKPVFEAIENGTEDQLEGYEAESDNGRRVLTLELPLYYR